jgi:hypothetical protein
MDLLQRELAQRADRDIRRLLQAAEAAAPVLVAGDGVSLDADTVSKEVTITATGGLSFAAARRLAALGL